MKVFLVAALVAATLSPLPAAAQTPPPTAAGPYTPYTWVRPWLPRTGPTSAPTEMARHEIARDRDWSYGRIAERPVRDIKDLRRPNLIQRARDLYQLWESR
jgi:hypothetical protein